MLSFKPVWLPLPKTRLRYFGFGDESVVAHKGPPPILRDVHVTKEVKLLLPQHQQPELTRNLIRPFSSARIMNSAGEYLMMATGRRKGEVDGDSDKD